MHTLEHQFLLSKIVKKYLLEVLPMFCTLFNFTNMIDTRELNTKDKDTEISFLFKKSHTVGVYLNFICSGELSGMAKFYVASKMKCRSTFRTHEEWT